MRVRIPSLIADLSGLEWAIVVATVGLILSIAIPSWINAKHRPVEEAARYSAWCKLTGNERGLTPAEFNVLYVYTAGLLLDE
jgi:hypothetical protein